MSGMGGGARCHHIVNTTMMSSWEFSLKLTINAHTHLHTATRIPTGPVMYPDADHFVQGLYIESMTAPITPNFCRNRLLHIKRCVKKIVIAHVFETCLLQVFEKKRLCITCA